MIAPVKALRKKDLEWLGTHHCAAHRHSYLEHYSCFLDEAPEDSPFFEKLGFFDIETTGLKGDYHYVLSYCILDENKNIQGRALTSDEIRDGVFDKNLMKELCSDMRSYHRLIGHYMERFDVPFVRTRCVKYGYDFPLYKEIYFTDTWSILKYKFNLSGNRLKTACEFFSIKAKEHPLTPDIWHQASIGQKEALDYIWTHNKEDVVSTKKLYDKIKPYVVRGKRSI